MYFHGARFSNYEAWLSDPTHIKPSAQVVWPVVGQEILNGDVGGGFQGIQITSGFFQLWRASGITSELQLYTTAIGGLVMAAAMFFAGWFHYHKAAPKLEWFRNVESMLNHHLAGLLGLGSLGWAGHQIHVSLPVNKLLDAGVDPKEIPLPHDFLLNRQIMADLYPSFAKGLAPFFTLQWGEYSDFLTFNGGLNPVTGGLWLSDTAHHHVAIAVLFLVAGHMYRTNWGIGHSMKEILESHKGPFTGEGHVGLYEILTTSWHAQLAINLAMFGSLSIIVARPMAMGYVNPFYMLEQPAISVQFRRLRPKGRRRRNYLASSPRKLLTIFPLLATLLCRGNWFKKVVRWKNLVGRVNQQEIQFYLDSSETTRRDVSLFILLFSQKLHRIFYFKNKWTGFFLVQTLLVEQMLGNFVRSLFVYLNNFFSFALASSFSSPEVTPPKPLPQPYKFQEYERFRPDHKQGTPLQKELLEWFIGFSEGDGSFLLKDGRPQFVINQADLRVLNIIRSLLGFGIVRTFTQDRRVYGRFTVGTQENVRRLIALFNGNLQLEKVQNRFGKWVKAYNRVQNTSIPILKKRKTSDITLDSAWLSGLFDAEGGLHSHIKVSQIRYRGKKNPPPVRPVRFQKRLYLKAYVDQKFELDTLTQIAKLFQATVTVRDADLEHYRVEMHSKEHFVLVLDYFTKYPLRSRKADAYAIWKKVTHLYVNSLHLAKMDELQLAVDRLKNMNALFKKVKDVLILIKQEQENDGLS
jgi:hypothetical protein